LTRRVEDQIDQYVTGDGRDDHPFDDLRTSVIIQVRPWSGLHEVVVTERGVTRRYYAYTRLETAEAAAIIKPTRWRPPDPETKAAAQVVADRGSGGDFKNTSRANETYRIRAISARLPRAEVRRYSGSCLPCADKYAAGIVAQRLNRGFARCRA